MSDVTEIVKTQIEAAITSALIKELTEENLLSIVSSVMNKSVSNGWNSKSFFNDVLTTYIEGIIRTTLRERIAEKEGIFKDAVNKVVTESLLSNLATAIEADLSSYISIKIKA
jgi:hypothetical protein